MSVIYCVQPETFKLIVDRKDGISHNGSFESTYAKISLPEIATQHFKFCCRVHREFASA